MEENELIKRVKQGNRQAEHEFIDRYKDNVFRTCLGFVHNKTDADDLTQEVFIKALQSVNKFRHEAKVSTWLYRIATNMSLNYIRNQKRKTFFQRIGDWFSHNKEHTGYTEPEATGNQNPDYEMEQSDSKKALQQALDKLPEKQRTAFILHKYEALSYAAVAETMNTTVSSVESLMHRAKSNLQKYLREFYEKNMQ